MNIFKKVNLNNSIIQYIRKFVLLTFISICSLCSCKVSIPSTEGPDAIIYCFVSDNNEERIENAEVKYTRDFSGNYNTSSFNPTTEKGRYVFNQIGGIFPGYIYVKMDGYLSDTIATEEVEPGEISNQYFYLNNQTKR